MRKGSEIDVERLQQFLDALTIMASGRPMHRAKLSDKGDIIDAISYGVNILADELTFSSQRLDKERAALERANRVKGVFLANMSHEIRTPMTAIVGFTEMLLNEPLSIDHQRDFLLRIHRNCQALRRLIDDILDLSKIESGELGIENESIPIRDRLEDFAKALEPAVQAKNSKIILHFDPSLPPLIALDGLRFSQVVNNLLSNSIKFGSNDTIELRARFESQSSLLEIEIVDHGCGISETQRERLFQPFSQGSSEIGRKYGGTGLGLALSRRLCKLMGGDLTLVESAFGRGATFLATFRAEIMARGPDARVEMGAPTSFQPALEGLRVLLVEDALDTQLLISRILIKQGAEVTCCSNGAEALRTLHGPGDPPDVILMDIQMPEMDGIDATVAIRGENFRLPVLALTAHAMSGEKERCLRVGFSDYISKPITPQVLVRRILDHCEKDVRRLRVNG